MLDLGESLLDRVEIRRIGRQEPEPCAGRLYDLADSCRFVATEIVHDDDITGIERGHELLLDIGAETLAVDRSVEDTRSSQPIAAQGTQEGQRPPVAMRSKGTQALALLFPSLEAASCWS